MSDKITTIKVSTATRDLANTLKQDDETLGQFIGNLIEDLGMNPERLNGSDVSAKNNAEEQLKFNANMETMLEEMAGVRRDITNIRQAFKLTLIACADDNANIKKVVDKFASIKDVEMMKP